MTTDEPDFWKYICYYMLNIYIYVEYICYMLYSRNKKY